MITSSSLGRGRLGNQMFQYALLRGVAAKTGFQVEISDDRKVTLWAFPIHSERFQDLARYKNTYRERGFAYTGKVFAQPDDTNFVGFFQSEKYFKHIECEIRNTFVFSDQVQVETACLGRLRRRGPLVSIHVRRRDYINNAAYADLYGDYYPNAMAHFSECIFLVVSDDIRWCRQRFQGDNIEFFTGSSIYVDLAAMAACDHHIISNSTYGWWGAWLNPSSNKRVVRPACWWGPRTAHLDDRDICPDSWETASI